jgi:small subunit ribosomal protein S7
MSNVLVFNKYDTDAIEVDDPGLERYIGLEAKIMPKGSGRDVDKRFHKSDILIVERLINKLMVTGHKKRKHRITSGHQTGKHASVVQMVEEAFEIIEDEMDMNPIEVLVQGVENGAPREEIITIEYGGARYPKAVECAPQRRIDITLRHMTQQAKQESFRSKTSVPRALADEIMNAYDMSTDSKAIQKKLDLERQADSSR